MLLHLCHAGLDPASSDSVFEVAALKSLDSGFRRNDGPR
jgi:hypothetical protein